ncbi:sodium- and chloride-dependent creatine transporter 1-like [Liolophura sinensis]|uniref:sodium- and chloride-dependent creatine transporter 1-like n=1 Tax=Liolophura sinensis TaxID=3198878 RepID=UPI003158331F
MEKNSRQTWAIKVDFLFATVGAGVGFGNVWRFPYVCYRNGGGVFLIPYLVCILCVGIPVQFLEAAYGQFMSKGVIGAWKMCPLFQGIGLAQAVLCFYSNLYYNVILAWVLYYLFSSLTTVLPWSTCGNPWNSDNCSEHHWSVNSTHATYNWTSWQNASFTNVSDFRAMDPATEYWEQKVLGISAGVEFSGSIKWDLALCLLLAWILVYFCVWKGIKLSGKISYVTVIAPYILLVVLLVRGATLTGAGQGIKYFLLPDWRKLASVQVWVEAGIQVFFSFGGGLGLHTSLASCNKFRHNCMNFVLKTLTVPVLCNLCTVFVFANLAKYLSRTICDLCELCVYPMVFTLDFPEYIPWDTKVNWKLLKTGPGLAFVAYPEAVAQMPIAPLWSCIFFLLLIFVGIDSQGGIYVEQLFEWYCGGRIIMLIVALECLVISYVYGINRLQRNLEYMLGFRLIPYFKVCWAVITPLFAGFLFIMDIVLYPEQTYNRKFLRYHFPGWAIGIGWTLASLAIVCIPGVMVYRVLTAKGTLLERLRSQANPVLTQWRETVIKAV